MMNSDLPFGGVGFSGYGRYHGIEGFKAFSNPKSVMKKAALKMYPFNKLYPPFTPEKQKLITFLSKILNISQAQLFKRFIWFLILLWIAKKIITGELSMKTYRKYKAIFNMALGMIKMMTKSKK